MSRFKFLIAFIFTLHISSFSQEIGRLPYQNFSHRDYLGHFQNWAIIQDSRGFIYSCNNNGVLEYDGNEWRKISINNVVARCIDIDSENRIWVGGQDQLGYLAPDSVGQLKYFSLNHLVDNNCLPFGMVRQVYATDQGIFFSTNNCLFRLKDGIIDHWMPKTFFHRTYHVFDRIFSVQPQVGLTVHTNDSLILVPGGNRFENIRIYAMVPYDNENILIATQSDGFFLYNTKALDSSTQLSDENQFLKPFYTSNDKYFKENWVYHGITMPNGWFAFGTYRGGVVIIDNKGQIIQHIGKEQGIQDETVWHLTLDNQDNIWLALNNGISYFTIQSPITSWDESLGIQGVLQSACWHNNKVYVSTNAGVFYKENNFFKRVNGILDLSWDITKVKSSDGKDYALVATGQGIFNLTNGKAELIKNGNVPAFNIYPSKSHSDIVFIGQYDGVGIAKYSNGVWNYLGRFDGVDGRVYSLVEDTNGVLWLTSFLKGIVRAEVSNPISLKFDHSELFSSLPHDPNFDEDAKLAIVNNELRVSSTKGLAKFDSVTNGFIPDTLLGDEFANGEYGVRIFLQDEFGTIWFESYKETHSRQIERANISEGNKFIRLKNEFNEIPRMIFYGVNVMDNRIVWIAGSDGLYRFDPSIRSRGIRIPEIYLRKVVFGNNKMVFGGSFSKPCADGQFDCFGYDQNLDSIPTIPYKSNTVSFYYSSPFYGQQGKMMYSCMLEGFDDHWSDWSTVNHKEYTNLPFGSYKFLVKSLSMYDVESSVEEYQFEIDRPWYHHPFVYVFYVLFIVLIILASVSIKTRMLKSSNIKLQNLVEQRTSELLLRQQDIVVKTEELIQQKEEIESQRDILEFQRIQSNASLKYALRIQEALLPPKQLLDGYFENFIIHKPKDVVSGDFYWYTNIIRKKDCGLRHYIAVADCTGHGVPGGFLSMIGSRVLNEIINEKKITDPAEILDNLDQLFGSIVNRDSKDDLDGMDISLCCIDQITDGRYLVTFSGANRPICYHKSGSSSVTVIKGSRKTIGGVYPNIDKNFQNHLIDLAKGDSLYLFTDGITDQNNEFGKRFTSNKFYNLLEKSIELDKSMEEISDKVLNVYNSFKGDTLQRDDFTIIGLKFR